MIVPNQCSNIFEACHRPCAYGQHMPYEIRLDHVPAGYAGTCAEAGEEIDIVVREFTSTEDGQLFIARLEGIPAAILEKIFGAASVSASTTDSLLAILRPDGSARVYWNEFKPTIVARAKKSFKAGELVHIDHIMDIERVKLPAEALAPDVGICYVFSFGWRKGLFFDFGPAHTAIVDILETTIWKRRLATTLGAFYSSTYSRSTSRLGPNFLDRAGFPFRIFQSQRFRI